MKFLFFFKYIIYNYSLIYICSSIKSIYKMFWIKIAYIRFQLTKRTIPCTLYLCTHRWKCIAWIFANNFQVNFRARSNPMHRNVYHACRSISFHEDYGFLNITDGIHVPCVHCTLPCIRKWYVHHSLTHRREWKIDETRARAYSSTFFFFFLLFFQTNFGESFGDKLRHTYYRLYVFISINNFTCKLFDETEMWFIYY